MMILISLHNSKSLILSPPPLVMICLVAIPLLPLISSVKRLTLGCVDTDLCVGIPRDVHRLSADYCEGVGMWNSVSGWGDWKLHSLYLIAQASPICRGLYLSPISWRLRVFDREANELVSLPTNGIQMKFMMYRSNPDQYLRCTTGIVMKFMVHHYSYSPKRYNWSSWNLWCCRSAVRKDSTFNQLARCVANPSLFFWKIHWIRVFGRV